MTSPRTAQRTPDNIVEAVRALALTAKDDVIGGVRATASRPATATGGPASG